ncbi:MAG: hypothetical protein AAGI03_00640 [Pseudomonadota bacterium]
MVGFSHTEFRERLRWAIGQSPYENAAEASEAATKNSRTISNLFSQKNRTPSAELICQLALALNVEPGWLMGMGEQSSLHQRTTLDVLKSASFALQCAIEQIEVGKPTIEMMIKWWRENSGRLESCDKILEYCDTYEAKLGERTKPVAIAPKGLAGETLSSTDPAEMDSFLDRMPENQVLHVSMLHGDSLTSGNYQMHPQEIKAILPGNRVLGMFYNRLILPVEGPAGEKLILNFAQLLEPPEIISNHELEVH